MKITVENKFQFLALLAELYHLAQSCPNISQEYKNEISNQIIPVLLELIPKEQ